MNLGKPRLSRVHRLWLASLQCNKKPKNAFHAFDRSRRIIPSAEYQRYYRPYSQASILFCATLEKTFTPLVLWNSQLLLRSPHECRRFHCALIEVPLVTSVGVFTFVSSQLKYTGKSFKGQFEPGLFSQIGNSVCVPGIKILEDYFVFSNVQKCLRKESF